MQANDAKMILRYLGDMQGQLRTISKEMAELEEQYNGLHGMKLDGMPHGSMPGDATAALALKMAESGNAERRKELIARREVLQGDSAAIRGQIDRLRGVYKMVLFKKYVFGHSWVRVACRIEASTATAKRKGYEGLTRLAVLLDDMPMADEILARARDARD